MNDTSQDASVIETADWSKLPADPLVSVHMLAYRHEKFIAQAIEGVVAQQCDFPIELLIAEDCSPDGTLEIALEYQKRYPALIRVLTGNKNIGMHANGDRCMAHSRGKFIAICEGDDYWIEPTKLSQQVHQLHNHPDFSLVCHAAIAWDSRKERRCGTIRCTFRSRELTLTEIVAGDGGLIPTASIMVRRGVITDLPSWTDSLSFGDYALAITAALTGKVFYIDCPMSVYRMNVPHSWTQQTTLSFRNRIRHADGLSGMFCTLQESTGWPFLRAARPVLSKHYSDALVRTDVGQPELSLAYRSVREKLDIDDHLFSWLSVQYGIRLKLAKTITRKIKTLTRLLAFDISSRLQGH
ncbi:MAG TPA: glycosyltransferase [Casimicrobium huifangae]|nr:glycosyltransferase [Casimicrobium huifangae]